MKSSHHNITCKTLRSIRALHFLFMSCITPLKYPETIIPTTPNPIPSLSSTLPAFREHSAPNMEEEDLCHDECSQLSTLIITPRSEIRQRLHLPPDNEKHISVDPQSLRRQAEPEPDSYKALTKSFKEPKDHRRSAELQLRRSKSCGDGRASAPSDEFDIMSRRSSIDQLQDGVRVLYESRGDAGDCSSDDTEEEVNTSRDDDSFKCGALCLFLPGISKKKPAPTQPPSPPPQRQAHDNLNAARRSLVLQDQERGSGVSLEKFECASWASAAILDPEDDDRNSNNDESGPLSYFDLPLELIRCSANESCSPVKAAFVFDKDLKGVLKKSTSRLASRKSCESSTRHVRFSTSAPTSYPTSPTLSPCITPRLLRAREEFNALLEATEFYCRSYLRNDVKVDTVAAIEETLQKSFQRSQTPYDYQNSSINNV